MNFCYYRLGPNGKPRWRPLYGISDCSVFRSITELRFKNEKMNFQFNAGGEGKPMEIGSNWRLAIYMCSLKGLAPTQPFSKENGVTNIEFCPANHY